MIEDTDRTNLKIQRGTENFQTTLHMLIEQSELEEQIKKVQAIAKAREEHSQMGLDLYHSAKMSSL